MKRVLVIATTPFYEEKGSSLRVYSMVSKLSEKYEIDLLTYNLGKDIELKNTRLYRTISFFKPKIGVGKINLSRIILDFLIFCKGLYLILSRQYSFVHCEDFEAAFIGYILSFFVSKKVKLIYDLHNRIIDNLEISRKEVPFRSFILFLERKIIQNCDLIILNWQIYSKDPVFKDKKTVLFYDKLDLKIEDYIIDNKKNEKYLIYVGNSESYQGIENFLNLFSQVKSEFKLVIVGKISENINDLINTLELNAKVFLPGKLSVPHVNFLIKKSIAGVLPRIYGRQPSMKMIHYLLMDKITIANDIECNHELLRDNFNGLFYKNKGDLQNILSRLERDNNALLDGVISTRNNIISNYENNDLLVAYSNL